MTVHESIAAVLRPKNIRRVTDVVHPIPSVPFEQKYRFVKSIGSGGEANCDRFDVVGAETHMAVAVKTIVRPNPHTHYLHEADILASLPKHPNVIEILEVFQGEGQLRIVMPLCSGGDITNIVKKFTLFGAKVPEAFVWHVFVQLIDAVNYIHTNHILPILHRDLKPQNILIDLTESSVLFDNVKLIDFGMATPNTEPHEHRAGTPKYQPPECPIASRAADVYAVGACIHYLMTGKAPKPECPGDIDDSEACHA